MNSPIYEPKAVFNRLFADGASSNGSEGQAQAAKLAKVPKSVLDAVLQDGARNQRLGAADKHRVEQHLEAIRAIELRLDSASSSGALPAGCGSATVPTVGKDNGSEAPPAVNTAMAELTAI